MALANVDDLGFVFLESGSVHLPTARRHAAMDGFSEGITMDRRSVSLRWPALIFLVLLLPAVAIGCKSALQTIGILCEGFDTKAEWDGLKGKKVAVVCRTIASQDFSNEGAARALAEGISERLKAHVKDIHIIPQQNVDKQIDENGMEDFVQIGKAVKAEKVVGVSIESFGVLDGQTLFRGRATVSVQVCDVAEKQTEWHKSPPPFVYPRIGSMAATDIDEITFRNKFGSILAEHISWYFYPHDRYDDTENVVP
jgi:hypothetical protein